MMVIVVIENKADLGDALVDRAVGWLRSRVPDSWTVDVRVAAVGDGVASVEVAGPDAVAALVVEVRRSLAPRDAGLLFGSVGRRIRDLSPGLGVLVVAPWLSPRTCALLAAERVNYVDLTGNALVRLDRPALFIETTGASRDPAPAVRPRPRVRGAKAGRLIRMLLDVQAPFGVRELASAAGLAPGYVSRLLDALDAQALVERERRGRVVSVDVAGLVRFWATEYDVFRSNRVAWFLAPLGAGDALQRLAGVASPVLTGVTGSFAAVRLAPVAAPALLAVYSERPAALADALGLLPADVGANVAVLRPYDRVVGERTEVDGGVHYVAPTQVAVDCLTGSGRMPAEGEAIVAWLLANQSAWRAGSLEVLRAGSGP